MKICRVNDFKSALSAAAGVCSGQIDFSDIEFSNDLDLKIKLIGENYDGTIDYNVAKFIIALQKDFYYAYCSANNIKNKKFSEKALLENNLKVQFKIEKGSLDITALLSSLGVNMTSSDTVLVLIAAVSVWGIKNIVSDIRGSLKDRMELKKYEMDKKLEEMRLKEEKNSTQAILTSSYDLIKSILGNMAANIIAPMNKKDVININGSEFTSEEAKRIFNTRMIEKEEKEDVEIYQVDGDYIITEIDRENYTCRVLMGDKKRKVSLKFLPVYDFEKLYSELSKDKPNKPLSATSLRINIELANGEYKNGAIIGLGSKRKEAVSYAEAFMKSVAEPENDLDI